MSSPESTGIHTPSEIVVSQSSMSRAVRLEARNVHIFDLKNRNTVLGGLYLAQRITNSSFYAMVDIFIVFSEPIIDNDPCYSLQTENGVEVKQNSDVFQPGNYYLDAISKSRS
jgi:hypothetical protein